jgi:general secretion pathway protein A
MYEAHFHLQGRPFRGSLPEPAAFAVPQQEVILAQLVEAFRAGEGFALLLGEAGLGKTFLARQLADLLAEEFLLAWVAAHPHETGAGFHQAILYDVGLPHEAGSSQELRLHLTDLLLENAQQGRSMLLIVDDAHHLDVALLEELRQWGNLGAPHDRLLQALLVGQPSLRQTLRLPALTSLRQQLAACLTLEPWDYDTAAAFLRTHLHQVGGSTHLLGTEALQALTQYAAGVPRLLSQVANRAFWLAAQAEAESVELEAVWEAIAELTGQRDTTAEDALLLEDDSETADFTQLTAMPASTQAHKAAG